MTPPGYRVACHIDERGETYWIVDASGKAVTPPCRDEAEAWEWVGLPLEMRMDEDERTAYAVAQNMRDAIERLWRYIVKYFTNERI